MIVACQIIELNLCCWHLYVLWGVEENFGGEFGVLIELTEVGFVIAFVIIFHVCF